MPRSAREPAVIEHLLCVATVRLCETIGVAVQELDGAAPPPTGPAIASTIGFTDRDVRGAVTLVVDEATLVGLNPGVQLDGLDALRDACGELSNLLLGELKRLLRPLGVTVQIGVPVTFSAHDLQLRAAWADESREVAFATPRGPIRVRLDLSLGDLVLAYEPDDEPAASGGDTIFF